MAIVGTLPFTLTNGTLADATQVQTDLQFIADQVNANAQPGGSSGFTDLFCEGQFTALVTATDVQLPFISAINDTNSEIVGGTFQPVNTGLYLFIGNPYVQTASSTTGIAGQTVATTVYINGVLSAGIQPINWPFADSLGRVMTVPSIAVVSLTAGNQMQLRMNVTFTGTAPHGGMVGASVRRIA